MFCILLTVYSCLSDQIFIYNLISHLQPELITKHGYIAETHHVWTEDGYRLELHRLLPRSLDTKKVENGQEYTDPNFNLESDKLSVEILNTKNQISRPPVLINHGLLSSSADWVLLGPQKALGKKFIIKTLF